jgi:hypothetical protein
MMKWLYDIPCGNVDTCMHGHASTDSLSPSRGATTDGRALESPHDVLVVLQLVEHPNASTSHLTVASSSDHLLIPV